MASSAKMIDSASGLRQSIGDRTFLRRGTWRSALVLAGLVILWGAAGPVFTVPQYLVPGPLSVFDAYRSDFGTLSAGFLQTAKEVIIGLGVSTVLGVAIGALAAKFRLFGRTIYPLIVGSQAVPIIAAAPLLVIWFGVGLISKVIITILISFFPIIVATMVGLRSVSPDARLLARSIGLSPGQLFFKVEVPYALPYLFGGLKIASALAVVGAVAAEFVGASSGLGYLVVVTSGRIETAELFASIVAMVILGIGLFAVISAIERLASASRPSRGNY